MFRGNGRFFLVWVVLVLGLVSHGATQEKPPFETLPWFSVSNADLVDTLRDITVPTVDEMQAVVDPIFHDKSGLRVTWRDQLYAQQFGVCSTLLSDQTAEVIRMFWDFVPVGYCNPATPFQIKKPENQHIVRDAQACFEKQDKKERMLCALEIILDHRREDLYKVIYAWVVYGVNLSHVNPAYLVAEVPKEGEEIEADDQPYYEVLPWKNLSLNTLLRTLSLLPSSSIPFKPSLPIRMTNAGGDSFSHGSKSNGEFYDLYSGDASSTNFELILKGKSTHMQRYDLFTLMAQNRAQRFSRFAKQVKKKIHNTSTFRVDELDDELYEISLNLRYTNDAWRKSQKDHKKLPLANDASILPEEEVAHEIVKMIFSDKLDEIQPYLVIFLSNAHHNEQVDEQVVCDRDNEPGFKFDYELSGTCDYRQEYRRLQRKLDVIDRIVKEAMMYMYYKQFFEHQIQSTRRGRKQERMVRRGDHKSTSFVSGYFQHKRRFYQRIENRKAREIEKEMNDIRNQIPIESKRRLAAYLQERKELDAKINNLERKRDGLAREMGLTDLNQKINQLERTIWQKQNKILLTQDQIEQTEDMLADAYKYTKKLSAQSEEKWFQNKEAQLLRLNSLLAKYGTERLVLLDQLEDLRDDRDYLVFDTKYEYLYGSYEKEIEALITEKKLLAIEHFLLSSELQKHEIHQKIFGYYVIPRVPQDKRSTYPPHSIILNGEYAMSQTLFQVHTILHELGHAISESTHTRDDSGWRRIYQISQLSEQPDQFPSQYAEYSMDEDYAESFALFVINAKQLNVYSAKRNQFFSDLFFTSSLEADQGSRKIERKIEKIDKQLAKDQEQKAEKYISDTYYTNKSYKDKNFKHAWAQVYQSKSLKKVIQESVCYIQSYAFLKAYESPSRADTASESVHLKACIQEVLHKAMHFKIYQQTHPSSEFDFSRHIYTHWPALYLDVIPEHYIDEYIKDYIKYLI
ncbi:MAG: hypothetical protein KDK51_10210, partial [Deltaproteobacteria bacterium]|nr:hypothetical protein [Deltaproteobacteria bacterium]